MQIATKSASLAVGICSPIIGGISTSARLYSRRRQKAPIRVDDYFAISAWFLVTGACATLIIGLYNGTFFLIDANDLTAIARRQHAVAKIAGTLTFVWFFANSSIKLSVLFFYRRIFIGKAINVTTWTLIGLTVIWLLYGITSLILYCGVHIRENFEGPWNNCPEWARVLRYLTFISDTILDFCVLIVPVPQLLRLHVDASKKLKLLVIFTLGGLAFVAGLLNTVYQFSNNRGSLSQIGVAGIVTTATTDGHLLTMNWPIIEVSVGLIACNLPSLSSWAKDLALRHRSWRWSSFSGEVRRLSRYSRSERTSWRRHSSVGYRSVEENIHSTIHENDLEVVPFAVTKDHRGCLERLESVNLAVCSYHKAVSLSRTPSKLLKSDLEATENSGR